ncbi:MAG: hypothetical protein RL367_524, partial [Pseudomonadota bacterium]
ALLSAPSRVSDAEIATAIGVYSGDALVQAYGESTDATDPGAIRGTAMAQLRDSFAAATVDARLAAMTEFWQNGDPWVRYARLIATAQAANDIQATRDNSGSADQLVASMLSVGLDQQAARWANQVGSGSLGEALLAVGTPMTVIRLGGSAVKGFNAGESGNRARFLLAGLAGLERMSASDAADAAASLDITLTRQDNWSRALDRAVAGSEKATVTLLVALGLQGQDWSHVSAFRLYRAVSALHRVGMDGEARMVAAEALMRS